MSETGSPGPAGAEKRPIRVVTAASLFDGHDAAINIMRRVLHGQGAEVIHLGHEDADAVAVSSYQGGHMEFFRYLVAQLEERGAGDIRVYGGGGGTITPEEAAELQADGVARIFRPEDGRALGLEGMIRVILDECARVPRAPLSDEEGRLCVADPLAVTRLISWLETHGEQGGAEAALSMAARL